MRVEAAEGSRRVKLHDHRSRTHLALDKDAPELRKRESIDEGKVIALPMVGGLHHRYTRLAAALRAFGNAGESSNSLGLLAFADMAAVRARWAICNLPSLGVSARSFCVWGVVAQRVRGYGCTSSASTSFAIVTRANRQVGGQSEPLG